MARMYGDNVIPDVDLPARVLSHPDLPAPVREALRAFEDAQDAIRATRGEVDAIHDRAADTRAQAVDALRTGKKPPAAVPGDVVDAAAELAEARVRNARNHAYRAAQAYEATIPAHRAELRALILAPLAELAAKAEQAAQEAAEAYGQARALMSTAANLDTIAAHVEPNADRRLALAAVVADHYVKVARQDAITHGDLSARIDKAWQDVRKAAGGIPVAAYAVDPLVAPDLGRGARLAYATADPETPKAGAIVWNAARQRYETKA